MHASVVPEPVAPEGAMTALESVTTPDRTRCPHAVSHPEGPGPLTEIDT